MNTMTTPTGNTFRDSLLSEAQQRVDWAKEAAEREQYQHALRNQQEAATWHDCIIKITQLAPGLLEKSLPEINALIRNA